MNKLKEGMYVRTKNGIGKINYFINNIYTQKFTYIDNKGVSHILDNEDILKVSSNIIDLIEVGDYVNGDRVLDIAKAPIKALYTNKDVNSALLPIINNEIKSVITKEQFESIKYEVE